MNKRIMLLTALIAASPVLHVAASADAMYNDIKLILEDRVTDKTDEERLYHIQDVLRTVSNYKDSMQSQIISLHARVDQDKYASLVFGALGALCFGVATGCFSVVENADKAAFAVLGSVSGMASVFSFCKRSVDLYDLKNKINELNLVIVKLEALRKPLLETVNAYYSEFVERIK